MKIRTDYVSNSSSSSFVIWGMTFSPEEVKAGLEKSRGKPAEADEDIWEEVYGWLDGLDKDLKWTHYDGDGVIAGISPAAMKDDETLAQFKQRVRAMLTKVFPQAESSEVEFIQGTDEDGTFCYE